VVGVEVGVSVVGVADDGGDVAGDDVVGVSEGEFVGLTVVGVEVGVSAVGIADVGDDVVGDDVVGVSEGVLVGTFVGALDGAMVGGSGSQTLLLYVVVLRLAQLASLELKNPINFQVGRVVMLKPLQTYGRT